MTVEGPATSGILRVSASLTTPPALWIALRMVRMVKNRRTSSTRSFTKKVPNPPKSNHSMWECTILHKSFQSAPTDAPKKKQNKDDEDDRKDPDGFQQQQIVVNVIFGGNPSFSKRAQKLLLREILSVEPAIQRPLKYNEVHITFSREDQWTSFSEPKKFPLVLDPVVQGSKLTRVLIDGGSGLNLIFASTLAKMGLNYMSLLTPSKTPFYGIVPGNSSTPIGSITLPITFGTEQNFRTEYIKFEVADFGSSYHAILGRPALAKFMAVPHYVYLLLKMPGNTGVLSLRVDLLKFFECYKEAIDMLSQSGFLALSAKYLLLLRNSHTRSQCLPRSQASHRLSQLVMWAPRLSSYKRETTPILPSSEQVWATNRNSSSSTSLGPTEMYSRGSQWICQGCPRT